MPNLRNYTKQLPQEISFYPDYFERPEANSQKQEPLTNNSTHGHAKCITMEKLINNVMIKISNCKGFKCSYLLIMRKFACSSTVTFTSLESMAYTTSLSLLLLLLLIFFFFLFVLADMINPHNSAKNIGTIQVICKERSNNKAIWDLAKGRHQDLLPLYLVLVTNVYYQFQYGDSSLLTLDNTPYKFPQGNTIVTSKPCTNGGPTVSITSTKPQANQPFMQASLNAWFTKTPLPT